MADPDEQALARLDARRYRLMLCGGMVATIVGFALGSAFQSIVLQLFAEIPVVQRLAANLTGAAVLLAGTWLTPLHRMSWPARIGSLLGWLVLSSGARVLVLLALGVYPAGRFEALPLELIPVTLTNLLGIATGVVVAEFQDRLSKRSRSEARQAQLASSALEALRAEELRVRRDVAEGLHGTVQQQLIRVSAQLRRTAAGLSPDDPRQAQAAAELAWAHAELERLREQDVRDLSRLLYPSGVDLGLAQAARILLRQIPPAIQVDARIDDALILLDDPAGEGLPPERRLLALRVLEEGVTNAIRHGDATRLEIALDLGPEQLLTIRIDDDGSGLRDGAEPSGLQMLGHRLAEGGGALSLGESPLGGASLRARLPLAR